MKRYNVAHGQARIVEIGCGNGNVLSYLSSTLEQEIWGADLFSKALKFCQERVDTPLVQLDTYSLPFTGALDVVCMFDTLEHLSADTKVLDEVNRVLRPGGRVVLTVPAYRKLWSYFDESSHHQRRYDKAELRQKMEMAGFDVEMFSHYMMVLLPWVAVGRKIQEWRHHITAATVTVDDMVEADIKVMPVVNEFLYWVCSAEKWLVPYLGLPFGTSIIAVGCKR